VLLSGAFYSPRDGVPESEIAVGPSSEAQDTANDGHLSGESLLLVTRDGDLLPRFARWAIEPGARDGSLPSRRSRYWQAS